MMGPGGEARFFVVKGFTLFTENLNKNTNFKREVGGSGG
ncbi:hypothetical protein MHOCP_08250 [Moorella humiferrea]|uniref:Uncharacterized protein n=1 Tax=Neomoorella humiferrea TaxID=676965 RepID=A0A2T0AMX2_9FIRM|nr:hypothetical protein MOHU_20090 [Moorella humiferrea]